MTATEQVTTICERLHLACRPAPDVQDADWLQWLAAFEEPRLQGRGQARGDSKCPDCGEPLRVKSGKFGKFLGCAGWPGCKYTAVVE